VRSRGSFVGEILTPAARANIAPLRRASSTAPKAPTCRARRPRPPSTSSCPALRRSTRRGGSASTRPSTRLTAGDRRSRRRLRPGRRRARFSCVSRAGDVPPECCPSAAAGRQRIPC
jgi:hypothetical protein